MKAREIEQGIETGRHRNVSLLEFLSNANAHRISLGLKAQTRTLYLKLSKSKFKL
jgi:hypothetical protein